MKKIIGVGLLMASASLYAADPVTLNITGNIIATPCVVSSDSITKSVDLGQTIGSTTMQAANATSPWTNFTVNLESCPAGTTSVTMTMHGTANAVSPDDSYANTGTAANVAVQLQNQAGSSLLGNGKSITGTLSGPTFSFPLRARAITYSGNATPGTIAAVVTATLVYN